MKYIIEAKVKNIKINTFMKKILLSGITTGALMLGISLIMMRIYPVIFPRINSEYLNENVFRPWSDPRMLLMFVEPFVLGLILAWVWDKAKDLFQQGGTLQHGILFGLTYWISTVPGMIMSYSTFPLSKLMIVSWSLTIFIQSLGAGNVLAKMNK